MKYRFLEAAKEELDEAVAHYESLRAGLGTELAQEVQNAIQRIVDFPNAWTPLSKNVYCCRTKRFTYGVLYTLRDQEILIVAVMHLHRKPGYWKGRLR